MKGADRLSELEEVLKSIEELRGKLNKIAEGRKLSDPQVVSASQMLDALLNEYQKLMKDKK
ncbi:MAG: Spo0E like sporulation regulatory protein [Firmicutes bacterium]|jgi:stage 0 sporulation regulatory protein|nr:Spo0E like sporulation regulatory protein [Bacillota bacterium]